MSKTMASFSLGVFIPVWNRGDVFSLAFNSLLEQLQGIEATIWIFDNGSGQDTKDILQNIESGSSYKIIKTFLPQNMGIPYAANVFAKAIQEECDFAGYRSPQFVLLMDADAYFKRPIIDLIEIFNQDYSVGLVSGHDSIEHGAIRQEERQINGRNVMIKEKENERMITMLMRKDEFLVNYPFPHYRNRDVDWEITQWNPNSMRKRNRKIMVACDYVLHLGIHSSTWNNSEQKLESEEEINEVHTILEKAGIKFKLDIALSAIENPHDDIIASVKIDEPGSHESDSGKVAEGIIVP